MQWLVELFQLLTCWFPRLHYILPDQAGVRITLGKHVKAIPSGAWWLWPVVQSIDWCTVTSQVIDLPPQCLWTFDGKQITVSVTIRYNISDARMALLKVQDYDKAIQNLTRGVVAEYISKHTLEDCKHLDTFTEEAKGAVQKECRGWGINIQRLFVDQITNAKAVRLMLDQPLQVGTKE